MMTSWLSKVKLESGVWDEEHKLPLKKDAGEGYRGLWQVTVRIKRYR